MESNEYVASSFFHYYFHKHRENYCKRWRYKRKVFGTKFKSLILLIMGVCFYFVSTASNQTLKKERKRLETNRKTVPKKVCVFLCVCRWVRWGKRRRDRNKQLKAQWHVAQTAWRLFVVESWGLLPQRMSECPGGGCLPSLLTHNPLQTPLLLSQPQWLTTLLSERGEDLFIRFFFFMLSSSSYLSGTPFFFYLPLQVILDI